jgi:hypothetical protein
MAWSLRSNAAHARHRRRFPQEKADAGTFYGSAAQGALFQCRAGALFQCRAGGIVSMPRRGIVSMPRREHCFNAAQGQIQEII